MVNDFKKVKTFFINYIRFYGQPKIFLIWPWFSVIPNTKIIGKTISKKHFRSKQNGTLVFLFDVMHIYIAIYGIQLKYSFEKVT